MVRWGGTVMIVNHQVSIDYDDHVSALIFFLIMSSLKVSIWIVF